VSEPLLYIIDSSVITAFPFERKMEPLTDVLIGFQGGFIGSHGRVAMQITVTVNGQTYTHDVEPRLLLVHYLRDTLHLTGTHVACETSLCGACTVMMDGVAVKSCTILAVQADGAEMMTIEGLAEEGRLHPVQEGFWAEHGLQCGFCTPGMIMTSCQLLARHPNPTDDEIRHALEGNLCRCTGYQHIVNAVQYAARKMQAISGGDVA
jgi:carbon-monoxide dehydrogenase small subunit